MNYGSIKISPIQVKISNRPELENRTGEIKTTVEFTDFYDVKQLFEIAEMDLNKKKTKNYWIKSNELKTIKEMCLTLYDGTGSPLESWKLKGIAINSYSEYLTDERVKCDFNWSYSSFDYSSCVSQKPFHI